MKRKPSVPAWLLTPLLGLLVVGCSEIAAPDKGEDFVVVGSLPAPTGVDSIIITSGTGIQYCASALGNYSPTLASFGALSCVAAHDLTSALNTYNPGWPLPTGAAWIGAQANANQYTVRPGSYLFRTTFTLPDGATDQQLNITLRADNAAFVYLNNTLIGSHTPVVDTPSTWMTDLYITHNAGFSATDTLSVILVNTLNGYPNNNCALGPQAFGWAGAPVGDPTVPTPQSIAGGWSIANCDNPSAVWFRVRVGYTPPTGFEGCTPGFWKNHPDAWPTTGYTSGQAVSSVFGSAFGADASASLLQALDFGGGSGAAGGQRILLRAAVAALLNAAKSTVDYPLTTAQVIAQVNAALASGNRETMITLAGTLDTNNNLGCPINGKE